MLKKRNKASALQDLVSLRDFPSAPKRRAYLEKVLQADLSSISNTQIEKSSHVHCENLVGGTIIPLGVAGPLNLKGEIAIGERIIPLATTEGALVASISRGCKALNLSGGVLVRTRMVGQTRGPVFKTSAISDGLKLQKWIEDNFSQLSKIATTTSSHILYKGAKIKNIGSYTFVRFLFDTGNAMGMNMVTIATEALVAKITKETKIKCISVAGNFDIDKKAAWLNTIEGRGFEVWAECVIPKKILKETLNTDAKSLYEVWLAKCMIGSYASGAIGFNAHFSNIISALFIATGQDPAHVVEGSCGITTCEVRGDDLFISINIPSLLLGTVGGGTSLPTQKAALQILGIGKNSSSKELAEIFAGTVLAGELSLLSALSTNSLATAHKKLGRSKKS